jgi:hypothetical protein
MDMDTSKNIENAPEMGILSPQQRYLYGEQAWKESAVLACSLGAKVIDADHRRTMIYPNGDVIVFLRSTWPRNDC